MSSPPHPTEEIFHRLLDETAALLAAPESAGVAIPDDELHREIIVPLLPALLGDAAIRGHWAEQIATGFPARLARHLDGGEPAPRWTPGDFEIHVTASYSAGADARALADTLLSEDSLRDVTAALMNQFLDALWLKLAPAPVPAEPQIAIEIAPAEVPGVEMPAPEIATPVEVPVTEEIFASVVAAEAKPEPPLETASPASVPAAAQSHVEPARAAQVQPSEIQPPSRALIRALCGKISVSVFQRGLVANSAQHGASAAIIARRIAGCAAICTPRLRFRKTGK